MLSGYLFCGEFGHSAIFFTNFLKKYPKEFFGRCNNYVKDYFVRLDRKNPEKIYVDVAMSQPVAGEKVKVEIRLRAAPAL